MTLLITGGAGFIGSAVIRYIIRHTQDSVINLDKLTYAGNLQSLAAVSDSPRYTFEHADICDRAALDRIFADVQPYQRGHGERLHHSGAGQHHCPCRGLSGRNSVGYRHTGWNAAQTIGCGFVEALGMAVFG